MGFEVVVVGAGPAGLLAALLLARAGVRVLLVDAKGFGRDKPCGEGLMPRGVATLARVGLGRLLDGTPGLMGIALSAGGRRVTTRFGALPGRGVRRHAFDAALLEEAGRAGAEVRLCTRARAVVPGGRGRRLVELAPSAGARVPSVDAGPDRVVAPVVVIADGGRSVVGITHRGGRAAGPPRVGLVAHVDATTLEELPGERAAALVEAFLQPGWQVVLTPVGDGAVSVAALVEPRGAARLTVQARGAAGFARRENPPARPSDSDPLCAWLRRRLEAIGLHISPRSLGEPRAIPLVGPARKVVDDGLLLVGDAAGAVDPVVGCGISLALGSAERAAATILGCLDGAGATAEALEPYAAFVRGLHRMPVAVADLLLLLARRPRLLRVAGSVITRLPRLGDALVSAIADPD